MNTYEKRGRGWPVIVNQESVKDSWPEKHRDERSLLNAKKHFYPECPSGVKELHVAQPRLLVLSEAEGAVLFPQVTGHRARNSATPRIMCPLLQESTPCAIASSAAPDGTSVKLVTACGDSPAGPAPTTLNHSTPSSAPSISAAISLTLPRPTATAAANKSSGKVFAPTKIIPLSLGRTRKSTSPPKIRPNNPHCPT